MSSAPGYWNEFHGFRYAIRFDSKVKSELVSQCRDRQNGGLGNFVELIELLFSQVRPEWKTISYQLIRESGRVLHTHTEHAQSFTGIKPRKKASEEDDEIMPMAIPSKDIPPEFNSHIDVASLPIVHIDIATYNDSLRHKMLK